MVSLTINRKEIKAKEGLTLLEAARRAGFEIPTLCHLSQLTPLGACRICLVEDKKRGKLIPACIASVKDGLVIETDSPRVIQARREMLKFLLTDHPDNCLVCGKGNLCELRQLAMKLEVPLTPYLKVGKFIPIEADTPLIVRDISKCVLCGRCIRACQEWQVNGAIDYAYRGIETRPTTSFEHPLHQSDCVFCGLCLDVCPVGALEEKKRRECGKETSIFETICPYCACGCSIEVKTCRHQIISGKITQEEKEEKTGICAKGRFGIDFVNSPNRVLKPMVRGSDGLKSVSWEEAIDFASKKFRHVKEKKLNFAALTSGKNTVEELYLFQKLIRVGLGSNNLDSLVNICRPPEVIFRTGLPLQSLSVSLEEIEEADVVFIFGVNLEETYPIIAMKLKQEWFLGKRKSIQVDVVNNKFSKFVKKFIQIPQGKDVDLVKKLILGIKKKIDEYRELLNLLKSSKKVIFLIGSGILMGDEAVIFLEKLSELASICGSKTPSQIKILSGQCNSNGVWRAGVSPYLLPGGVSYEKEKEKFENFWKVKLPDGGMNWLQIWEGIEKRHLQVLFVMGANPAASLPQGRKILKNLDFLIVSDLFLTETANYADIILPASSFAEKEGTFIDVRGRERRFKPFRKREGESLPDGEIILSLARGIGGIGLSSVEEARAEMKKISSPFIMEKEKTFARNQTISTQKNQHKLVINRNIYRFNTNTLIEKSSLGKLSSEKEVGVSQEYAVKKGIKEGQKVKLKLKEEGELQGRAKIKRLLPPEFFSFTFSPEVNDSLSKLEKILLLRSLEVIDE